MKQCVNFTESELKMISNGLLALINNAIEAQKLIQDSDVIDVISKYVKKTQKLNGKICKM